MLDLCAFMFFGSVATLALKNNAADNIIQRKGKIITDDNRSLSEKFMSFLGDYTYLFIPFYNAYKTIKLIRNKNYVNDREALLNERERIKDKPVKKEVKQEPVKKVTTLEPVKVEKRENTKEVEKKETPFAMKPIIRNSESSISLEELNDLKDYYYSLDHKYREEYERLKNSNASVEQKNAIIEKVIEVDDKFKKVVREIKIRKLQNKDNTKGFTHTLR